MPPSSRLKSLRISDLEAFCAVAERLSYVAAARSIGMNPSTVTRAVQALEEALGRELVSRNQRNVSLTPAGEAYYEIAKSATRQLSLASDAVAKSSKDLQGWVRFSAPAILETRVLPQALAAVSRAFPKLRLDVTYTDAIVDPAQAGLDFAIRGGYPSDSNLIGQTLWRYDRYLCASPSYVALYGVPSSIGELTRHRFVIHTGPRLLRDWHLTDGKDVVKLPVDPAHRVSTGPGLIEMVVAGMGITRLASWVAEPMIEAGSLIRICPDYTIVSRLGQQAEMHAVYQSIHISELARVVLDGIKSESHRT